MRDNKKGFSVLISILIIGFLMVLTVGTFNIVLGELNDSKGNYNYLKASYAADAAGELALLTIKNKGYGYYKKVDNTINDESVILSNNPKNKLKFKASIDPLISYDLNSKSNDYNGILEKAGGIDIIPLFYIDKLGIHKLINMKLSVNLGNSNKLTWNILGKKYGIGGFGSFDSSNLTSKGRGRFKDSYGNYIIEDKGIKNFLINSENNYLILMNIDPNNEIKYNLSGDYFTLPRINILASGKIGKYKQNLDIFLDNTQYLARTRYSIYGN